MPDHLKATFFILCALVVMGTLINPSIKGLLSLVMMFYMYKVYRQIVR